MQICFNPFEFYLIFSCFTLYIELPSPTKTEPSQSTDVNLRQYSVQALVLLADLIAPLLDVVYRSEEKDKVVPLLYSVMSHVFPYLRNHRYL